jgi:hypothetical protein
LNKVFWAHKFLHSISWHICWCLFHFLIDFSISIIICSLILIGFLFSGTVFPKLFQPRHTKPKPRNFATHRPIFFILFEKENFDSLEKENFDSLKNESFLTVWKGQILIV